MYSHTATAKFGVLYISHLFCIKHIKDKSTEVVGLSTFQFSKTD